MAQFSCVFLEKMLQVCKDTRQRQIHSTALDCRVRRELDRPNQTPSPTGVFPEGLFYSSKSQPLNLCGVESSSNQGQVQDWKCSPSSFHTHMCQIPHFPLHSSTISLICGCLAGGHGHRLHTFPDGFAQPFLLHQGTFRSLLASQAIPNLNHTISHNEADAHQPWRAA